MIDGYYDYYDNLIICEDNETYPLILYASQARFLLAKLAHFIWFLARHENLKIW